MEPLTKAYLGVLSILGLWGGAHAWAQGTALEGTASAAALGIPLQIDLGNLTVPGAVVVCFWMLLRAEKLPAFRVRVYHFDNGEPTNHGVRVADDDG